MVSVLVFVSVLVLGFFFLDLVFVGWSLCVCCVGWSSKPLVSLTLSRTLNRSCCVICPVRSSGMGVVEVKTPRLRAASSLFPSRSLFEFNKRENASFERVANTAIISADVTSNKFTNLSEPVITSFQPL